MTPRNPEKIIKERKRILLSKTYASAVEAREALNNFLRDVDSISCEETRGNYQHLRAIGNRIFD